MRQISLIVATVSRVNQLDILLNSLNRQTYLDFEVLVVDQNPDDRLLPVLQAHSALRITHLRCPLGVSRARNVGLRAAHGEVISFPDDDCWYPDDLLAKVIDWLGAHPDYDVLFTGMRNQHNRLMLPKWPPPPGPCKRESIWECSYIVSGFFRRKVIETIGEFDESIGPGPHTIIKACEDSDYCMRPLDHSFRVWFEPSLAVYHPDLQSTERLRRNMYSYAVAHGFITRRHGFGWYYIATRVMRSLGGAAARLFRGDPDRCRLYLSRAVGQWRGYVSTSQSIPIKQTGNEEPHLVPGSFRQTVKAGLDAVGLLVPISRARLRYFQGRDRRETGRLYRRFIRPGDLCFDVGANVGVVSDIMLDLGAHVVAVEPQAESIATLRHRFSGNPNFVLVPKGLAASAGTAEFLVCDSSDGSSMSPEFVEAVKTSGRVDLEAFQWREVRQVPTTTLDQLITEFGLPAFVKIDVEGLEDEVLKGCSQRLRALSFEFTPERLRPALTCIEILQDFGSVEFNYTYWGRKRLLLPRWVSGPELAKRLQTTKFVVRQVQTGDVYARYLAS